eukprot:10833387-Alexandrium_andersonii.AAC.1
MRRGVRQGGPASPLLWLVSLGELLTPLRASWLRRGFGVTAAVGREKAPLMVFADDITLFAASASQLR